MHHGAGSKDGDSHQIFFDRNTENWKIIHEEQPKRGVALGC